MVPSNYSVGESLPQCIIQVTDTEVLCLKGDQVMPLEKTKEPYAAKIDPRYVRVVEAFAGDRHVSLETRKGFGSGALKVNGKIFAMLSSKRQFIVKLPKNRVDELVNRGKGQRFDLGHGRIMKEWFVVGKANANWAELAKEAYDFMKQRLA